MNPTPATGCTPEQREAIRQVHPYQEPQCVPDPEVEVVATQELAAHSPDGRPAAPPAWNRGRLVLMALLFLGLPAVIFAVWRLGGTDALLMGLVYVVVLMLVAYPVWYSGMMRFREKQEATDIVRHTLSTERFGPQGRTGKAQ